MIDIEIEEADRPEDEWTVEKSEVEMLAERLEARIDALIDQRHRQGQARDFELDRISRKIEQTINAFIGSGQMGEPAAWFERPRVDGAGSYIHRYVYSMYASGHDGPLSEGAASEPQIEQPHIAALDIVARILTHLRGVSGTVHWRMYPEWREHEGRGQWRCRLVVVPD